MPTVIARRLAAVLLGRCSIVLLAATLAPVQNAAADAPSPTPAISNEAHAQTPALTDVALRTTARSALDATQAHFGAVPASHNVRELTEWIIGAGDNGALPFVVIDKGEARVFAFDSDGSLRGASPALLGLAVGDDSVPGIGERKLSDILPGERTTPAGRFVAVLGNNLGAQDVLWVDYENAISLHRVITTSQTENRLQRLATDTPLDNRISYGCINVPVEFYETVIAPAFTGSSGIVYILPETRPLQAVFSSYNME